VTQFIQLLKHDWIKCAVNQRVTFTSTSS